jgi:hypothetical protein
MQNSELPLEEFDIKLMGQILNDNLFHGDQFLSLLFLGRQIELLHLVLMVVLQELHFCVVLDLQLAQLLGARLYYRLAFRIRFRVFL